jgi:chromosome segregation ATPase
MNYCDTYTEYSWVKKADVLKVSAEIQRLSALVPQMQEELAKANTETALLRKAYEELAEAKSGEEAKNARLKEELADRDAVLAFFWEKIVPTK